MGLLEKWGLIEKIEEEPMYGEVDLEAIEPEIDANVEGVSNENLVSDIYNANSLSDLTKSIFKVEELINSLPKEMATKTKRDTVLAILASFGLTSEIVAVDGANRVEILGAALKEMKDSYSEEIARCQEEVENRKKEIEELQKYIAITEQTCKSCNEKITYETERINGLIAFLAGGN